MDKREAEKLHKDIRRLEKKINDCYSECEGACAQYLENNKCECQDAQMLRLLQELKQYREDEEQGILKRFPCPVDSTVYEIRTFLDDYDQKLEKCVGCKHYYEGDDLFRCDEECSWKDGGDMNPDCLMVIECKASLSMLQIWEREEAFNKTVFIAREQAEAKMKEIKGEPHETDEIKKRYCV